MMISPMVNIEKYKKMTINELVEEKKELMASIADLEKIVFDDVREGDEWRIHPGPDVIYQEYLEELGTLIMILRDKYGDWNGDRLG